MKNFTNNFKQFTSRLSARWLIMALTLLLGTSSAWAATLSQGTKIYVDVNTNSGWWASEEAEVHAYFWGTSTAKHFRMTYDSSSKYYVFTSDSNYDYANVIFVRMAPNVATGDGFPDGKDGRPDNWGTQTEDLTYDGSKNLFTFTTKDVCWNGCKVQGEWSTYNPCTKPSAPSITINGGSSAKLCSESATITTTEVAGATAYNLYKDDSNTASQTNETGTFTVSEAGTYYVTVTTCDESPKQATGVKLEYYSTPTLNNKYSKTNSTACGSTSHNNGTVTITPAADVTYTLTSGNITYKKVDNTWSNLSPGDYVLTATSTYCADLSVTERIEISEVDKTPTLNDISIKGGESVCQGGNLTLQLNGEAQDGVTYTWYKESKESEPVGNGSSLNLSNIQNDATYILVASKTSAEGCPASKETSKEIKVNLLPTAPSLTSPAPVCEGTKVNLPTEGLKWYDAETGGTEVQNTSITATGTYWAAAVQNECESATRTRYDVTVNPEPTIGSITQNVQSPVPFEDVVLTANNVTDGAQVKWYVEENLIAENTNTYTVTSETAGDVIVKAKAFLNGCESATTKTVKFSAEDCSDRENTTTTRKTKITCSIPSGWKQISCYTYDSNKRKYSGEWPGTVMTSDGNNYSIVIDVDDNMKDLYVIFNNNNNGEQTKDPSPITGGFSYTAGNVGKGQTPTFTKGTAYNESTTTTTPAEITAPAVKMVSAEYDEENDVIVAKGAVYKTGCGTTFWGFQYSTNGQTWGTTNEYFIHPSGNSLSVPGEFEYSFAIPNAGGGDIYYIRAYALNNYNKDSYNLSSAVYSTTSLPVEIPSKTIESATISLVDSEGKPSDATVVCPQSTVYLKVSYVGGDFKEYEAADNFPGTNLELVNHDKVNNYAIFSYTATATGVANITISNDNTSVTTTNGVNITLKNVAPVNAPMISISQATICEGGNATITVNNQIAGLTYTLYKETESIAGPVIYNDVALTFNVTEASSYTVRAEESVCNNYANSMAVELKVVTSDVKIGLAVDKTTVNPWQPLKLTVTAPEGYAYTIVGLENVVYTQSGNVYTVKIPRPTDQDWPIKGNSGTPVKTKDITFEAKIQVTDDLTCGSSSITVKLEDTEENCK